MKIPKKRELQQITFNHSTDMNFQDFMNLYKDFYEEFIKIYCRTVFFFGH